jgi:uncharacterized NAD(P)/FAD-binding protein YdhS
VTGVVTGHEPAGTGSSTGLEPHPYDVAFVGAGASTSYVLLSLLGAATEQPPGRPLRIAVVEREPDAFAGIPYGDRAARSCLLITQLRDFLPPDERRLFTDWLSVHKDRAFQGFLDTAGPFSQRWWERHRGAIGRDEFEGLFLPRYVFGDFLTERVQAAVRRAADAGAATVDMLRDEVLAVTPDAGSHRLTCAGGTVPAHRVVLGIGSAPVRPRVPAAGAEGSAVLVDDPFDGMVGALDEIRGRLGRTPPEQTPRVVLLGANASTMDLLYQINDLGTPQVERTHFVVLSPRGELPERVDEPRTGSAFVPRRLRELLGRAEVDAVSVYEAACADIAAGRAAGLTVTDTLQPVSEGVRALLPRLSAEQAAEFAGRWGAQIGRYQRRAGGEYCEVVEHLTAQGRIELVAGSFVGVRGADGGRAQVRYEHGGLVRLLEDAADVVVNCAGPAADLREVSGFLPARLFADGVCHPTPYGGGIAVDGSFAAAPGLYVMGPLLAGNVVGGSPIWHMEHCGRISSYGSQLGSGLARELMGALTT